MTNEHALELLRGGTFSTIHAAVGMRVPPCIPLRGYMDPVLQFITVFDGKRGIPSFRIPYTRSTFASVGGPIYVTSGLLANGDLV